jgi:hypothetical protein
MSDTRKRFLTVAGLAAAGLAARADAKAAKAPSPAAREFAQRFRRYDPLLTSAQMTEIEKGIDELWKLGGSVHKGLENGDGTSPAFETGE